MDILWCMDMFLITKTLDLAYVQNYMRCISQNKSDTKLFRVLHILSYVNMYLVCMLETFNTSLCTVQFH